VVSGFYRPDRGHVLLEGQTIDRTPANRRRSLGISRTFQTLHLYEDLSVLENMLLGLHLDFIEGGLGAWNWITCVLSLPSARRRERDARAVAMAALEDVGLTAYARIKARHLPYGLKKRLEVGRALLKMPRLLLLDEPTAGLSIEEANDILALFKRHLGNNLAVLLIEHRLDWVLTVSHRIAVLDAGRKIAEGRPADIAANKEVMRVYAGTA
jgi:ABC-type branched-subunit amino acid transport system ATPase component